MSNVSIVRHKLQAKLEGDLKIVNSIREQFSVPNKNFRRGGPRFATRTYCITPQGKFDIGLLGSVLEFCHISGLVVNVEDSIKKEYYCGHSDAEVVSFPGKSYRDYQEETIKAALAAGRGVSLIATAGGKTLIMAGLIKSLIQKINIPSLRTLVIVPTLQLVSQTATDFIEYGMTDVDMWSGKNPYNPRAKVVVAGTQNLLSDSTDLSVLQDFDIVIADEVHGFKRGNSINEILKFASTPYKFGFTGSLPEDPMDKLNIIGKFGPITFQKKTHELRESGYVANFKIVMLKVNHSNIPNFKTDLSSPAAAYQEEQDWLASNGRRNGIICNLANKLTENTIIMVDRIEHGLTLLEVLKNTCDKDRPIFFIRGSMEVEDREKIRVLMSKNSNVIVVAISKIFSTGINIPNLHNVIFATIGKAFTKILQSIGRIIRLHKSKSLAMVFDISDNTKYGSKHAEKRQHIYKTEKYEYSNKEIS